VRQHNSDKRTSAATNETRVSPIEARVAQRRTAPRPMHVPNIAQLAEATSQTIQIQLGHEHKRLGHRNRNDRRPYRILNDGGRRNDPRYRSQLRSHPSRHTIQPNTDDIGAKVGGGWPRNIGAKGAAYRRGLDFRGARRRGPPLTIPLSRLSRFDETSTRTDQ
jgi:hypothetical protein